MPQHEVIAEQGGQRCRFSADATDGTIGREESSADPGMSAASSKNAISWADRQRIQHKRREQCPADPCPRPFLRFVAHAGNWGRLNHGFSRFARDFKSFIPSERIAKAFNNAIAEP